MPLNGVIKNLEEVRAVLVQLSRQSDPDLPFDSTIYTMELNGKRIVFTGDIGFEGVQDILHRCWGDREKAAAVAKIVRTKVLSLKPDHVLTGHGPRPQGTAWMEDLLTRTEASLANLRPK